MHYQRQRKGGSPFLKCRDCPNLVATAHALCEACRSKPCSADGCSSLAKGGFGLCPMHYQRKRNHGQLELPARKCADCSGPVLGSKVRCQICADARRKAVRSAYQKLPHIRAYRLELKRRYRVTEREKLKRAEYQRNYIQRPEVRAKRRDESKKRKHARRAHERGSAAERFSLTEIFERDGWICKLCYQPTLRSKRGTQHPRAPVLDHIIPISRGGPHTRLNVQCACHACNTKKFNRPLGQLLLVG